MSDDLPPGWALTDIGSLGRYINGRGFGKAEWKKSGMPIIRIQNLNDESAPFNYSDREHEEKYRVRDDDLLVAWAASLGVYVWKRGPAWLNQHIFRVEVEERAVTKPFLSYTLKDALAGLYKKAHGSGMVHITKAKFDRHPVRLPPLNEQKRIVAKIDELFSRIDEGERALERVSTLVERYRQSVLKAAVTGELTRDWREACQAAGQLLESGEALLTRILTARREAWEQAELAKMHAKGITPKDDTWKKEYRESAPPDISSLLDLPKGWTWAAAESLCESVHSGTTPERELLKAREKSGVPFIKVYNLTMDGVLDFSIDPTFVDRDHHRNRMVRSRTLPGDVLTNIVGPPLGKVSLVPDSYPEWNINQAVAAFRPRDSLLNRFLSFYLQSEVSQSWLRATTKTTTSQVNLAITTCRRLPIPVPPLAEQSRICDEVERLLSNANAAESTTYESMRRSDALRQSVLKAAFEGELVVQDPTDEPASILLQRIALERVAAPNTAEPKCGRKKKSA